MVGNTWSEGGSPWRPGFDPLASTRPPFDLPTVALYSQGLDKTAIQGLIGVLGSALRFAGRGSCVDSVFRFLIDSRELAHHPPPSHSFRVPGPEFPLATS